MKYLEVLEAEDRRRIRSTSFGTEKPSTSSPRVSEVRRLFASDADPAAPDLFEHDGAMTMTITIPKTISTPKTILKTIPITILKIS